MPLPQDGGHSAGMGLADAAALATGSGASRRARENVASSAHRQRQAVGGGWGGHGFSAMIAQPVPGPSAIHRGPRFCLE